MAIRAKTKKAKVVAKKTPKKSVKQAVKKAVKSKPAVVAKKRSVNDRNANM